VSRNQVASSTVLQMLIYFNLYLSVMWAILFILLFQWKTATWDIPLYIAIVTPVFYLCWLIIEPIRLALGYFGNLNERVAYIGPFLAITVVPQMLIHLYLITGQRYLGWITLEIELFISLSFLLLYTLEVLCAWRATNHFVSKATANFQLQAVDPAEIELTAFRTT